MSNVLPIKAGRLLPLYRCHDPLSGGHLFIFTDPARTPQHGGWIVVGVPSKRDAQLRRFDHAAPTPDDGEILGVPDMLCIPMID